jgi:flagellar hook-associated protein 2
MVATTDYVKALGVGSGLDTKALVTAMVNADSAGRQSSIDRRSTENDANISGMAQVKSALNTLKTSFAALDDKRDFNFSTINNSDPTTISAKFDGALAQPGTFSVTVSSLAQAEIRQSTTQSSATTDLNSGASFSFTLQVGSNTAETISLAADDVTLTSIAAAINASTTGASAWVVQTAEGSYKLLTQGPMGASNSLTIVDSTSLIGIQDTSNRVQSAQDASLSMNGVSVVRGSNSFSDLIPGVTLDLLATNASAINLTVARDSTAASTAITNVATAYNAFETIMKDLTAAQNTLGERGVLNDDSGIKNIRSAMYAFMTNASSTPGTTITSMADMGITRTSKGIMKIDATTLAAAVSANYDDITKLFSADTNDQSGIGTASRGLAGDLVKQVDDYLSSSGIVTTRSTGYTAITTGLTKEQTELDVRTASAETRYTKQFSTMNKIMQEMKSMQDYLKSQLENLPFTSDNN